MGLIRRVTGDCLGAALCLVPLGYVFGVERLYGGGWVWWAHGLQVVATMPLWIILGWSVAPSRIGPALGSALAYLIPTAPALLFHSEGMARAYNTVFAIAWFLFLGLGTLGGAALRTGLRRHVRILAAVCVGILLYLAVPKLWYLAVPSRGPLTFEPITSTHRADGFSAWEFRIGNGSADALTLDSLVLSAGGQALCRVASTTPLAPGETLIMRTDTGACPVPSRYPATVVRAEFHVGEAGMARRAHFNLVVQP